MVSGSASAASPQCATTPGSLGHRTRARRCARQRRTTGSQDSLPTLRRDPAGGLPEAEKKPMKTPAQPGPRSTSEAACRTGLLGVWFRCDFHDGLLMREAEADAHSGADAQSIALEVARSVNNQLCVLTEDNEDAALVECPHMSGGDNTVRHLVVWHGISVTYSRGRVRQREFDRRLRGRRCARVGRSDRVW